MANLFDDARGVFRVLANAEGQFSLWPVSIEIPEGWQIAFGPESKDACLKYVNENWSDMRPASLRLTQGHQEERRAGT